MKKIRIRSIPGIVKIILIVWVIAISWIAWEASYNPTKGVAIAGGVLLAIGIITAILARAVKTTAEFGEGSIIKFRWLLFSRKTDIEQIRGAAYSLKRYKGRGGVSYRFELRFYNEGRQKPDKIEEILSTDDAESCVRGNYSKAQLMQVYRYIEQYDSRKAFGLEKE